jgi:hypothetical protein
MNYGLATRLNFSQHSLPQDLVGAGLVSPFDSPSFLGVAQGRLLPGFLSQAITSASRRREAAYENSRSRSRAPWTTRSTNTSSSVKR